MDTPSAHATEAVTGRDEAVLRYYAALGQELQGPLASLSGWLELLAVSDDPQMRADATAAARSLLRRLRRLADDTRDSAAAGLGHFELRCQRVDLATVVEALTAGDPDVTAAIPGPVVIEADGERVFQMGEALLATAAASGGHVSVSLSSGPQWAEVQFRTDRHLPFATLQGLFEGFSRPEDIGAGLSLHLCRALAVAHGGQVGTTGDESGTTLWLRLPAYGGI